MEPKIDTIPLPEFPREKVITIPKEMLAEFKDEIRIIIKFPWIVGIPVPEILLEKLQLAGKYKGFDFIMIPNEDISKPLR